MVTMSPAMAITSPSSWRGTLTRLPTENSGAGVTAAGGGATSTGAGMLASSCRVRWQLLLQYFGEAEDTVEPCNTCDNCQRTRQLEASIPAPVEVAPPPATETPLPLFSVGSRVRVPRHEEGEVIAIAGDMVTIAFGDGSENKTFLASYVQPSEALPGQGGQQTENRGTA